MDLTINKQANELRRGHVILAINGDKRVPTMIVFAVKELPEERTEVQAWDQGARMAKSQVFPNAMQLTVEAPEQRVNDEEVAVLVEAARDLMGIAGSMGPARRVGLEVLVDRLSPVQAPTLQEALLALDSMASGDPVAKGVADRLLKRARRAGVLS